MKKTLSILILIFLAVPFVAFAATNPPAKSVSTVFTANIECLVGFAKNDVINCVDIPDDQKYLPTNLIEFKFDPVNNYYYTDIFYAYCQAFSRSKLNATVKAPKVLKKVGKNATSGYKTKTYEFIPSSIGRPDVSGSFTSVDKNKNWAFTAYDTVDTKSPEPRVIMSQPIQLKCTSDKLDPDSEYQVIFTIEVVSGGN